MMEKHEEKLDALEKFCNVRALAHEEKRAEVVDAVKSLLLSFDVMEGAWSILTRFARVWEMLELDNPKTLPKSLDGYLEDFFDECQPSCSVREKARRDVLADEDWLDWICETYLYACGNRYLRSEEEQAELFKGSFKKLDSWNSWLAEALPKRDRNENSRGSYFFAEKKKCNFSDSRAQEIEKEARKVADLSYTNTEDNREEVLDIAMKRLGETIKGIHLPESSRRRAFLVIAGRLRGIRLCAGGDTEEARRGVWIEYLGALDALWTDVLHDLNE